jgi:hemolysin activation/secretion protein
MRPRLTAGTVAAALLTLACTHGISCAAEGAGGILQQLEKTDKNREPVENQPPVILNETPKPARAKQPSARKIFVRKFHLEGNSLISEEELLADIDLGEGKELTLDEIKNVADMITAKYREKGFIIVNAYVPSQSIFDGAYLSKGARGYRTVNAFGNVLIKVIEGKVGSISVSGNTGYSSAFIERHLEPVRKDPSLKLDTLEKGLLLLNDYPSLSVKSTLKAGKEPGTTDIYATVSDTKYPLSGSVTYDNYGEKATSRDRLSAQLNIGNTITSGDLLRLNGIIGIDNLNLDRLAYGRAEYSIPVGGLGTQMGVYYSNTTYSADGIDTLAVMGLQGSASIAGLYASHPVLKKLDKSVTVRLGGEYISLSDELLKHTQDKDEIRKITAGIAYESVDDFKGRNFINVSYARGLGGFLGGTTSGADPGPSYAGADDFFNKFNLDATRLQKLPGYNLLIARGTFQYSSDRLFSAERMQLGGMGSVRGFGAAQKSGDSGYAVTLELESSPFFPDTTIFHQKTGDTIKFALFTDCGGVINTNPQSVESTSTFLSSIGAGLRLYGGSMFTFKLDWAIPGAQGSYNSFSIRDSRVYVQTAVSF